MSATTALSINASIQAATANQQAHEAKVVACKAYLPTFNAQTATIAEARQYADCVSLVYPHQIASGDVFLFKLWIVCMFVATACGAVKGYKEDGLIGSAIYAFMFVGCAIIAALFLSLLVLGGWYLFT